MQPAKPNHKSAPDLPIANRTRKTIAIIEAIPLKIKLKLLLSCASQNNSAPFVKNCAKTLSSTGKYFASVPYEFDADILPVKPVKVNGHCQQRLP